MNTIQYRYEVGYDALEAVGDVSARAEAIKLAEKITKEDPLEVTYIFDRMAHKGKPNLWHLVNGNLLVKGIAK